MAKDGLRLPDVMAAWPVVDDIRIDVLLELDDTSPPRTDVDDDSDMDVRPPREYAEDDSVMAAAEPPRMEVVTSPTSPDEYLAEDSDDSMRLEERMDEAPVDAAPERVLSLYISWRLDRETEYDSVRATGRPKPPQRQRGGGSDTGRPTHMPTARTQQTRLQKDWWSNPTPIGTTRRARQPAKSFVESFRKLGISRLWKINILDTVHFA